MHAVLPLLQSLYCFGNSGWTDDDATYKLGSEDGLNPFVINGDYDQRMAKYAICFCLQHR